MMNIAVTAGQHGHQDDRSLQELGLSVVPDPHADGMMDVYREALNRIEDGFNNRCEKFAGRLLQDEVLLGAISASDLTEERFRASCVRGFLAGLDGTLRGPIPRDPAWRATRELVIDWRGAEPMACWYQEWPGEQATEPFRISQRLAMAAELNGGCPDGVIDRVVSLTLRMLQSGEEISPRFSLIENTADYSWYRWEPGVVRIDARS